MLPESKNLQIVADNIRSLENQIKAIDASIPPHTSTDSGKILAVDSEGDLEWKEEYSYTPPSYSTEEVNTGQKWIDGKNIYQKTLPTYSLGTSLTHTESLSSLNIDKIIKLEKIYQINTRLTTDDYYTSGSDRINTFINPSNSSLTTSGGGSWENANVTITIKYTKSEPVPETKSKRRK